MSRLLSRRRLFQMGLLGGMGLTTYAISYWWNKISNRSPLLLSQKPFQIPLKIPPVLEPVRRDATTDYYELEIRRSQVNYLANQPTEIWGYNGLFPGPTIRPQEGHQSSVRIINLLDRDTQQRPIQSVVHLHGMAVSPEYDGYAMDYIPPRHEKTYIYPNGQSGTLWYHDHVMDFTARNVNMGLAGLYIVDDPQGKALGLPEGDYDVPLFIQSKQLGKDGQWLLNRRKDDQSLYGEYTFINGIPYPYYEVANCQYRFRLLNSSPTQHYQLALSRSPDRLTAGEPLVIIGSDGGLLSTPVYLASSNQQPLPLGIGERYDVVIDFSRYSLGSTLYLHHVLPLVDISGQVSVNAKSRAILRFDIQKKADRQSTLPKTLKLIEPIATNAQTPLRTFEFSREAGGDRRWLINQKVFDHHRIDANPQPGSIEIWTFINRSTDVIHPVHLHLAQGQLLDRNGQPPRPYEQGWKDVFLLGGGETVRVAFQFHSHGLSDVTGIFMMHCHQLIHEDRGMMSQFTVGEKGLNSYQSSPAKPHS